MFQSLRAIRNLFTGGPQSTAFLSFDVEALLIRAPSDHVDRLIWGKTDKGEYGLRRICKVLRDQGVKANFFVELAACTLYGDKPIREVCEYILSEGHELHAHLHPEILADRWDLAGLKVKARRLHEFDWQFNERVLTHSFKKFTEVAGRAPTFFRSGSYRFDQDTITAAKNVGFTGLSNYNSGRHTDILPFDPTAFKMEPFQWTGGPLEIPVDISSPETGQWNNFLKSSEAAFANKQEKTVNVVMHSWSLLRRNPDGHHLEHGPELEEKMARICGHLSKVSRVMGYDEYAAGAKPQGTVAVSSCRKVAPIAVAPGRQCPQCAALMSPKAAAANDGACVSCGRTDLGDFSA